MAGGAEREYAIRRCVAPTDLGDAIVEELLAIGFTGFAIASRADGGLDLELYALGAIPAAVDAALARLGLASSADERRSERELLAAAAPERPFALVDRVWIDPAGGFVPPQDALVLRIPPSAAFGDGLHPSTRIAAELLRGAPLGGTRVLDLGCGTGVLGILAQCWGAGTVAFADIDEDAVRATRESCALNGMPGSEVQRSDLLADVPVGPFDVIIANLYADPLLALAEDGKLERVLPRGEVVLSGIALRRREEVRAAFVARGFSASEEIESEWWGGMRMRR